MYRFIASIFQTVVASTLAGNLIVLIVLLFGGFLIQKRKISLSYCNNLVSRIYSDDNASSLFSCSLYACLAGMGILVFSIDIWGDRPDCERVSCPQMGKGNIYLVNPCLYGQLSINYEQKFKEETFRGRWEDRTHLSINQLGRCFTDIGRFLLKDVVSFHLEKYLHLNISHGCCKKHGKIALTFLNNGLQVFCSLFTY